MSNSEDEHEAHRAREMRAREAEEEVIYHRLAKATMNRQLKEMEDRRQLVEWQGGAHQPGGEEGAEEQGAATASAA